MDYPGDPALTQEIRTRVLTTFRQTAELAEEGRLQEASLGCDFILKMDPRFDPARKLQDRLTVATGRVTAADLVPGAGAAASTPAVAPPPPPVAAAGMPVEDLRTVQFSPQDLALSLADEGVDLGALFEAPPAPTPEPPPATPAATEATSRIDELLAEGQRAFELGQYQSAIDAWSRIFLIDLDHAEASRRIEAARGLKLEQERVADEQLHEGVRALEEGRHDDARAILERLVADSPNHLVARDYLARLPGGALPAEPAGELYGEPPDVPLPASFDPAPEVGPGVPAMPRPAGAAASRGAAAGKGQARVARGERSFLWLGAAGLVVLVAGGWFLATNWQRLFPRTEQAPPPAAPDPIEAATQLHAGGNVEGALARLRLIPRMSPDHARAQELIAEWSASIDAARAGEVAETADAEAQRLLLEAERAALLERARRSYEEREYLRAAKAFRAAEQIAPLVGAPADLYADTKRQLLPIAAQIDHFQQREWTMALPTLWRQHVDDQANRDVRRLLVDTLFNLGVEALREGEKNTAAEHFRDVVRLAPDDALAQRLLLFAEKYQGSTTDLVFQILATQLEFRS